MTKKAEVQNMFDSIAWRYDFLNHLLSFGTDLRWRRKAVDEIAGRIAPSRILDLATGTCDLAIESLRLKPEKVIAIDISQRMLEEGRKKIYRKKLDKKIELLIGDSQELPFEDRTFVGDLDFSTVPAGRYYLTGRLEYAPGQIARPTRVIDVSIQGDRRIVQTVGTNLELGGAVEVKW